ncbi:bifunctional methionine sulfoxide reductase B/A protein [candidate division KSB1 bacterium]|nr:bifunctional methionine sulfoxide reductase B/A protein [candidate division KSB1 bacterium]RQW05529.1 MAG: bifunctional methionine sulfoxide reductase B/A protein [candidate division KSB1 bacterium]
MKIFIIIALLTGGLMAETQYNKLTKEEERIIIHKGTERPWSGDLLDNKKSGTYICAQCNAPLYKSADKFDSHCGWPSFDDEIKGAVKRQIDADGRRTEILCVNCGGHLGHVFLDEGFTPKNTRHCVNSLSMNFIEDGKPLPPVLGKQEEHSAANTGTAIFAGGCFWGVEFLLEQQPGVLEVVSGYTGGHKDNPTYREVCSHTTGHIEAAKVTYDPNKTNYETLARYFFEIHDPTQVDRQGPDIGEQYRSVVFYENDAQKEIAQKLINILKDKGYKVATRLEPATKFWVAEDYHQNYYEQKGTLPYCHAYTKRF